MKGNIVGKGTHEELLKYLSGLSADCQIAIIRKMTLKKAREVSDHE